MDQAGRLDPSTFRYVTLSYPGSVLVCSYSHSHLKLSRFVLEKISRIPVALPLP